MPFLLTIVGLTMIVTGVRNTSAQFGQQLVGDFTGSGNFIYWVIAIGAVGSLGYVPSLKPFSRAFMALIIVAMVLKNGGVFSQFTSAIQQGPQEAQPAASTTGSSPVAGSSATSSDNVATIEQGISTLASYASSSQNNVEKQAQQNFGTVTSLAAKLSGFFG